MNLEIAIVEDEQSHAIALENCILRFCKENGVITNIRKFADGDMITENYKADIDVIFMDIQMKHLDGLKTADFIRKLDQNVVIVFVTNMPQFAIEGYRVNAQGYLLKPIEYESLKKQLELVVKKTKDRHVDETLLFKTDNGMEKINVRDIVSIQSIKHRITFYLVNGKTHEIWGTLSEVEKKLAQYGFTRCSKYCIVNLKFVEIVKGTQIILSDGSTLDLGGTYKKEFKAVLLAYVRDSII